MKWWRQENADYLRAWNKDWKKRKKSGLIPKRGQYYSDYYQANKLLCPPKCSVCKLRHWPYWKD